MSLNPKLIPKTFRFAPVAWDEAGHRYVGMVVAQGIYQADGGAATWIIGVSVKTKHPKGTKITMTTAEVEAAHKLWLDEYAPTNLARLWNNLIRRELINKKPSAAHLLTMLFPKHEQFPDDTTMDLAYAKGDIVNEEGHPHDLSGKDTMEIWSHDASHYVLMVSERTWSDVRELAVTSGLFERVGELNAIRKQARKEKNDE